MDLCWQSNVCFFNMLSRLVIAFLPRKNCILISCLQSPLAVILEPKKIKSVTVSTVSPSICCEVMGPDAMILDFWMLSFKPTFPLSSFTFIKRLFSSLLSAIRVVSSAYLMLSIFLLAILIPACAWHFTRCNKGPTSQGYGFPSCHVWMWELDYEENWVLKNGYFWTVVLEKTLENPLDCKEIQSVHPKGYQSWLFIGRTDAEAETPILWPPDVKNWLIWKDPDPGKHWRWGKKGTTEDEMVAWHHWLNGPEFE